jgi:hypothetical protein
MPRMDDTRSGSQPHRQFVADFVATTKYHDELCPGSSTLVIIAAPAPIAEVSRY